MKMRFRQCVFLGVLLWPVLYVTQARAFDFESEVRPILISRCVRCHGPEKQQGGLRLDLREHAILGGESGQAVIETPVEQNELWRRVQSPSAELRMPLDGPPLTEPELSRLKTWVEAGAYWPTAPSARLTLKRSWIDWLDRRVLEWQPLIVRLRPTLFVATGLLLALAVASYLGRRQTEPTEANVSRWSLRSFLRVTPAGYLLVVLGVVIHAAVLQAELGHEQVTRLEKTITELRQEVTAAHDKYRPPGQLVRLAQLPGLRRTYYRGNDERSPQLFNGGFYRTATIDLSLLDSAGETLEAGSRCSAGRVQLVCEIRRAKNATKILFTDDIAKKLFLSPLPQDHRITDRKRQVVPFEIVEPEEFWRVNVAIGEITATGAEQLTSRWFVIHGSDPAHDETIGVAHYGIEISLLLRDGIIQPGSDLWMAALLHAPKTIATPAGYLHSSEWLDFRPIPEIEGEPTTDPVLLGTPQHGK